jgi:hypothetical protein
MYDIPLLVIYSYKEKGHDWGMVQVVENLHSKYKDLSLNLSTSKKKQCGGSSNKEKKQ